MSPIAPSRGGVCKLFTIAHELPGSAVQDAVRLARSAPNRHENAGIAWQTQSDETSCGDSPGAYSFHWKGILCELKNLSL